MSKRKQLHQRRNKFIKIYEERVARGFYEREDGIIWMIPMGKNMTDFDRERFFKWVDNYQK